MKEFSEKKYINPGRLANIYMLMIAIWDLLEMSPLGEVFNESEDDFKKILDDAINTQGAAVTEETELERFLSGLKELIASNPKLLVSESGIQSHNFVIGKRMEDGIFLLPAETLNELMKIKVFTQIPTIDSMTQALNDAGMLIVDGKHLKFQLRLNGARPRGWYLKAEAIPYLIDGDGPEGGD
jgi:hypothetical protein